MYFIVGFIAYSVRVSSYWVLLFSIRLVVCVLMYTNIYLEKVSLVQSNNVYHITCQS
jgi:hypothetical protein